MAKSHRCGWVVLMGPPNAGKSTLTNALIGQKVSIVTSKPQTTRNRIIGICSEDNAQVIFMDTPGLHHDKNQMRGPLGKQMIQATWQSLSTADAIMMVLDSDLYIRKPEFLERDIASFKMAFAQEERPVFIIVNKVDLFADKAKMLPLLEKLHEDLPKATLYPLSAAQKDGIAELKKMLIDAMPEGEPQFPKDQLSTAPTRFLCAEIIREKVFDHLRQEVPYTTAVDIEHWEEIPEKNQTIINAVIYVARSSHKAMVIGRAGATIKEIGTLARKDIQELIGGKVHLELWVKVKENWLEEINLYTDEML